MLTYVNIQHPVSWEVQNVLLSLGRKLLGLDKLLLERH